MFLLFGHDQTVADWMSKKWGKSVTGWYYAIGILDNQGLLRGGITLHNYNGSNVELSYYGPSTISRNLLSELAYFLIEKLKIQRVTLAVPRRNKHLLRVLPKLGYKVEGVLRHYYGPYKNDDAIIFGMLASEGRKFLRWV